LVRANLTADGVQKPVPYRLGIRGRP
jgi:hypothetical protein